MIARSNNNQSVFTNLLTFIYPQHLHILSLLLSSVFPVGEVPPAGTICSSTRTSSLSGWASVSVHGRRNLQRPLMLTPVRALAALRASLSYALNQNHAPFIPRSWNIKLDKLRKVTRLVSGRAERQPRCLPAEPRPPPSTLCMCFICCSKSRVQKADTLSHAYKVTIQDELLNVCLWPAFTEGFGEELSGRAFV